MSRWSQDLLISSFSKHGNYQEAYVLYIYKHALLNKDIKNAKLGFSLLIDSLFNETLSSTHISIYIYIKMSHDMANVIDTFW